MTDFNDLPPEIQRHIREGWKEARKYFMSKCERQHAECLKHRRRELWFQSFLIIYAAVNCGVNGAALLHQVNWFNGLFLVAYGVLWFLAAKLRKRIDLRWTLAAQEWLERRQAVHNTEIG